jgi:hypothetical protein
MAVLGLQTHDLLPGPCVDQARCRGHRCCPPPSSCDCNSHLSGWEHVLMDKSDSLVESTKAGNLTCKVKATNAHRQAGALF